MPRPLSWFVPLPLLAASLLAQPRAPTAAEIAARPAPPPLDAPRAAAATPLTVNTQAREEVRQFYRAVYSASENVPMAWTGNYATGAAGDTSEAYKESVRLRVNFFRALAGLPAAITFNANFSAKDQPAALMMSANNALSHTPPSSWTFFTAAGAEAANNSNLAIGHAGADAVTGYIADGGDNNAAAGHRRWLLYPPTREMGTGDVPGDATFLPANALWVIDGQFGTTRPATRTTEIPYPPAGVVPYPLIWPRWSFSHPGADFSAATVTMTRQGQTVPVALEPGAANVGEPTLVWVYNGLNPTLATIHPRPTADTTYTVNVTNVRLGAASRNFTYNVTVFDPDVAGTDFTPVAIAGPATPTLGAANSYRVALPAFAGGFEWRTLQLATFAQTYGAEAGLEGITATTNAGYDVVQTGVVGTGRASFHLAHPPPTSSQLLLLPELFFVTDATAAVSFLSRLGVASSGQVARVQASADDGATWTDIYTQAGTGDGAGGEPSFRPRTASLAAYPGRTVRVRFNYSIATSGSFFPQTSNGVGWYLDAITLSGVQSTAAGKATSVASGTTFTFSPTAVGPVALQARGVLFGAYPLEWGPLTTVTAGAGPGGGGSSSTSYLTNLSVRTTAGNGAQTLIVGFVISGGSKPLLVRSVGPGLAVFGVPNTIPDPKLEMYFNTTKISENDNWEPSAAAAFNAVGAFALPANSKDAALVTSLAPGSYSAQASGVDGTGGITLVELYDTAPGTDAKLVNVSARSQVGTGGDILIAGFAIGGTGARTLLIRAIGPTLAAFGVTGALANPKLELYRGSTLLQTNDDWDATVAPTFGQVGAFQLGANSRDAVLLVTLEPGNYTAQISGVGSTTGVALVEVYEVP